MNGTKQRSLTHSSPSHPCVIEAALQMNKRGIELKWENIKTLTVPKSYELLIRSRYILYLGQVMSGYSSKYHRSISHLSQLLIHFFRKRPEFLRRSFQHRVINLKNGKFTSELVITPRVVWGHAVKRLSGRGRLCSRSGIRRMGGISEYQ